MKRYLIEDKLVEIYELSFTPLKTQVDIADDGAEHGPRTCQASGCRGAPPCSDWLTPCRSRDGTTPVARRST